MHRATARLARDGRYQLFVSIRYLLDIFTFFTDIDIFDAKFKLLIQHIVCWPVVRIVPTPCKCSSYNPIVCVHNYHAWRWKYCWMLALRRDFFFAPLRTKPPCPRASTNMSNTWPISSYDWAQQAGTPIRKLFRPKSRGQHHCVAPATWTVPIPVLNQTNVG